MSNSSLTQRIEAALWSRDLHGLATLPMTDPRSWAGSVQADFRQFGTDVVLHNPNKPLPACHHIAVVMMIKDEGDIINHNLYWLYFSGIRRFVILDNGSKDDTRSKILGFRLNRQDVELVIVDDPRIEYAQAIRTTGLIRLAVSLWSDVRCIVPADADEFLIAKDGFEPLLMAIENCDAVTIPKVVHYCSRFDEDDSRPPMSRMVLRSRMFLFPPKVACRASINLGVSDGNHHAIFSDRQHVNYDSGFSLGLYYREYQLRSFLHFKQKIMNGGPAVLAAKAAGQFTGGSHWLQWYQIWNDFGDDGLREVFLENCTAEPSSSFVNDPFDGAP